MSEHAEVSGLDDALLARMAVNDGDAFAELYRRHADRIYRYVYSRISNDADAQDVTAQTFVAAMRSIHRFRSNKATVSAWFTGIARHKVVDYFRMHKPHVPLEEAQSLINNGTMVDVEVMQRLDMQVIRIGLEKLAVERAEVIRLRIFGGLSLSETAEVMNKSEGAVKMLFYRAIQDLRGILQVSEINGVSL